MISFAAFQQKGEWAVNGTNGLATFPGDADYEENKSAAQAGRVNPATVGTPPINGNPTGDTSFGQWKSKILAPFGMDKYADGQRPEGSSMFGDMAAGFFSSRVVIIILGLICIGMALLMFKPTQQIAVTAAKTAATAA